jgi:hypothetical protein
MIRNNKLWFVFLFVMLASGCEKKPNTLIKNQTDVLSSDISETHEIAEQENAMYEGSDDSVDKTVVNDQLTLEENTVPFDFSKISISDFLSEYFQDKEYIILEEPLDVNYREIYFAVHYIMEVPKIFDIAVGFQILNESAIPYFFIKDYQFIDKNNTVFMNFSKGYDGIYGFNFLYSYPTVEGYTPGLVIETYFDRGKRIADSFKIMWNEEAMTFEDIKPDNPLWRPGM